MNLDRRTPHWDDVRCLIGALKFGLVPAMGILCTLQVEERPTRLTQAIADIGRLDKTFPRAEFHR